MYIWMHVTTTNGKEAMNVNSKEVLWERKEKGELMYYSLKKEDQINLRY